VLKPMSAALFVCASMLGITAGEDGPLDQLSWRNIGPVNMTGRVADVEGIPGDPRVVYVGSASGGIWKTVNGGLTFTPIFDEEEIASIGDMAIAPANRGTIYVGTGEGNPRNSVSFGKGVYKSTDGGAHWQHLGLTETRYIARLAVHPRDPDVVLVGAIGHIYGPHPERGVFRSTDGGASWSKTLYIDELHGASDLDMDPTNPNIVFAGMWLFQRKPWTHTSGSEAGGLFKSIDGGVTWREITKGLPALMGRIAVKVAPSDPRVVYVMAESNEGVLFRSNDGGESFVKVNEDVGIVSRGFYYTDLRVDPTDADLVYSVSSRMWRSSDGGKHFERFSRSTHVDYHSLWIDPTDPNRMWQGQDGGIAVSYDRGDSWEPIRNLPLAQFYQIYADNREPFYYVGGGLQDNGAWYGPVRTREPAGILPDDWRLVSFGDAYFMVPHPDDPERLISEYQGGGIIRTDMRTRASEDISPQPRRNDGGPVEELPYRFSWNAPIIGSSHIEDRVYFCGNVVFRSDDFGSTWTAISPDLSTDDPEKQGIAGGPVWEENTTAEYHCTIISFAESSLDSDLLWAGTDDGELHVSEDGGDSWRNLTKKLGTPKFAAISHVEPSLVKRERAYVALDHHMFDDQTGYILGTENLGKSWQRIDAGLPAGAWVWVVREDPRNPELLYAGTELGLFASWDRGESWEELDLANLPSVAVHDLLVHPRENDLILGTHGRAIYVFDDATPIQDLKKAEKAGEPHLFPIREADLVAKKFTRYGIGDKAHTAANPPDGALISYYLPEGEESKEAAEDDEAPSPVKIEVLDSVGEVLTTLEKPPAKAGVNRIAWNLRAERYRTRTEETDDSFFSQSGGPTVPPGTYRVRLTVGEVVATETVAVVVDPGIEVAKEDLEYRYETVCGLREMISEVNDMLRAADSLKVQVEDRFGALETLGHEPDEDLRAAKNSFEKALGALLDLLAKPEGKTFWSQGNRLSNDLTDLYFGIDGAFRAPSEAQTALLETLRGELAEARARYEAFVTGPLAALQTALEADGGAPLVLPVDAPDTPQ